MLLVSKQTQTHKHTMHSNTKESPYQATAFCFFLLPFLLKYLSPLFSPPASSLFSKAGKMDTDSVDSSVESKQEAETSAYAKYKDLYDALTELTDKHGEVSRDEMHALCVPIGWPAFCSDERGGRYCLARRARRVFSSLPCHIP